VNCQQFPIDNVVGIGECKQGYFGAAKHPKSFSFLFDDAAITWCPKEADCG